MPAHFIIGIIALVGGSVCGMTSTFALFKMADEVNERLPEGQRFAPLGWYWSKYRRLMSEYRRLYPGGRLLRRVRTLMVLMFACLLIAAWGFGIFGR